MSSHNQKWLDNGLAIIKANPVLLQSVNDQWHAFRNNNLPFELVVKVAERQRQRSNE